MFSKTLSFVATITMVALSPIFAQRPKILTLHGGGGSSGFRNAPGMVDLEAALPEFEFVYATGGFEVDTNSYLWIPDPPSKDDPTTSPNVADASLANLDRILEEEGPFFGILGYSQGAAFVPVYLANAPPGTFEKAMMFCGYLTETHLGLLDSVRDQSPFGDISSLIWIGEQDFIIAPSFSQDLIPEFTSPTVITSPAGGHSIPGTFDNTFNQVIAFVRDEEVVPISPSPAPPPVDKPDYDEKQDYNKSDYDKSDYDKSDYDKSDYDKSDYDKSDYNKSDYDETPNEQQVIETSPQSSGAIHRSGLFFTSLSQLCVVFLFFRTAFV